MSPSKRQTAIHKIALLGCGTMGSQIAAHCANTGLDTLLYGISSTPSDPDSAAYAINRLRELKPAPLVASDAYDYLNAADYQQLHLLEDCDLVIEAVSEDLAIKQNLYKKIAPHLKENCILASNTSGIQIEKLADGLDPSLRARFCGMHFFNPPRYMELLELIPSSHTNPSIIYDLEAFATSRLGKHIVVAKDTPGFIANRLGLFALMITLHHAGKMDLSFDAVDELTGLLIGHPKSATFRTIDLVGIDILKNVCTHLYDELSDDPWRSIFKLPEYLETLIERNHLGQKSGAGIYQKQKDGTIYVLDKQTLNYVPRQKQLDDDIKELKETMIENYALDFQTSATSDNKQARFLYAIHRDLFHYTAHHASAIAHTLQDIDTALRWGFGWQQGIFEHWQKMGWQQVCQQIQRDIVSGRTLSDAPLASWTSNPNCRLIYFDGKVWSPENNAYATISTHPVYKKQLFAISFCEEPQPGKTIFENESIRLWHDGDEIAVVGMKTKMHTLDYRAISGLAEAIKIAEQNYQGLIIWQQKAPFCAGANLLEVLLAAKIGKLTKSSLMSHAKALLLHLAKPELPSIDDLPPIDAVIEELQNTFMHLRNSRIPTVAAVQGLALGGGCELLLHCDHVVAALESYIGLVEIGVGLLPAGGGCKEMACRAYHESVDGNIFSRLQRYYRQIATAKVSASALEAQQMGYLRSSDTIVINAYELLHAAKQYIHAFNAGGYRPPRPEQAFETAGSTAAANFKSYVANLHQGNYISDYDRYLADLIAEVLCAVELPANQRVDAKWFLKNERHAFLRLLNKKKTQARIEHMLKRNKALRN